MQSINPLLHVGFNNFILTSKIIGIVDTKSSNARKLIDEASQIIDCTKNRARQSLVLLNNGSICISCIARTQLKSRLFEEEKPKKRIKKWHIAKKKVEVLPESDTRIEGETE